MNSPLKLIDLFSGAGGLTLGFTRTYGPEGLPAFKSVWANDVDKSAAASYSENFGDHCVHGDLVDLLESGIELPDADVVIGGPPCQGFSLLNKKRKADPRKQLWRPFMDVVDRCGAEVFVMENVRQLLSSSEIGDIKEQAHAQGFTVADGILCAADYGVPQIRHRAFVVGARGADPSSIFPPTPTHREPVEDGDQVKLFADATNSLPDWRTVRDVIHDLPAPVGTEIRDVPPPLDLHFGRNPTEKSKKRYRAVPPGGNRFDLQANAPEITPDCWVRKKSGGTDLFGRLWWDRPSVTIRTEFFKPEKGRYLHPVEHRPITHREAARIQSFPDDFRFQGSKIEIARQIGNAVPPLLAAAVARVAYELLTGSTSSESDLVVREPSVRYA